MSPDSKFTRQMAGLEYVVGASSKCARLVKSKLVVVRYTSGSFSHWCQIDSCAPRHQWELYRGILHHTLVAFARQHFLDNYHYQEVNTTLQHVRVVLGYPILTRHTHEYHANRQFHAENQVCLTRFTTITIQWHLGMLMQPISHLSINATTNLPKYTLNKIMHTIHRQNINPANHPASQAERIWIIKWYLIPGCNNLFPRCIYRIHCHIAKQHGRSVLPN